MVARTARTLVAAVILAGCAAAGTPETPGPTATPGPAATPTVAPSPSGTPLKLVWLSDSTGIGVAEAYGKRIEHDLGVPVDVTNAWTGNLSAGRLLDILRGGEGGQLQSNGAGLVRPADLVRDADIVVLSGSPILMETPGHPWQADCANGYEPDPSCGTVTACGPETWATYEVGVKALFDEVFKIRGGKPVILRTHDWYLPWGPVATWKQCACLDACLQCQREHNAAIHRAAASRNVPVAGYFAAFAGPKGDIPLPSDWMADPVHVTIKGAEALAGVMADLGYEPVKPVGG